MEYCENPAYFFEKWSTMSTLCSRWGISREKKGPGVQDVQHIGTPLDNGFAVTSIPRGKEWLNGKVNRPST